MPWSLQRFQESGQSHFITFSCYHRRPLFTTNTSKQTFETALERVRGSFGLLIYGYVVMPEHVHLLVSEPHEALLAKAIQALKLSVSVRQGQRPFWQARYYDFNVWSEAKRIEKLRYIHRNPVRRGLVSCPEQWPWSSFRHYVSGAEGVVEIESQWTARKRELLGITPQLAHRDQIPRPVSAKNAETRTGHPRTR